MDLKCPKCGKSLSSKEEMAEHTKMHAEEGMDKMNTAACDGSSLFKKD